MFAKLLIFVLFSATFILIEADIPGSVKDEFEDLVRKIKETYERFENDFEGAKRRVKTEFEELKDFFRRRLREAEQFGEEAYKMEKDLYESEKNKVRDKLDILKDRLEDDINALIAAKPKESDQYDVVKRYFEQESARRDEKLAEIKQSIDQFIRPFEEEKINAFE